MSQKHNSYIIKTRLNEWLLDSVLYICYFIILLIPPFLYVWTPSKTAKYLRNIYNKNWNSNYIIDITATERECENNSEKLTLGYWSGVGKDSCLCSFENKVQFATDDNSICKKRTYKEIFNCASMLVLFHLKNIMELIYVSNEMLTLILGCIPHLKIILKIMTSQVTLIILVLIMLPLAVRQLLI